MNKALNKFLLMLFVLLIACNAFASITAPTYCKTGELSIIQSDVQATWTVYPKEYSTSFYVTEDGKTLCFASPKEGEVVFIAASVKDGQAVIDTHTLYNGVNVPDDKEDKDEKEDVTPEPVTNTLESVTKSVCKDKSKETLEALAESFDEVVSGIERGTIRTPVGARETFRALWSIKASKLEGDAKSEMESGLNAISEMIDNSSIDKIKTDYTNISDYIRSCLPVQQEEPVSSCPDGNCPNAQYYNSRWGWRQ